LKDFLTKKSGDTGTKMANIFVTYDINKDHTEYKKSLLNLNYMDCWKFEDSTFFVPNTTLWSNTRSTAQAKQECESIAKKLNVKLERFIVVEFSNNWNGIPGEKHTR